jgi:hypothetical protein
VVHGALAREEVPHGVAEQPLVFGEVESHGYFLGSPRMRSAITFRWISFVPA